MSLCRSSSNRGSMKTIETKMWHEKYKPRSIDELVIHKNKVRDFSSMLNEMINIKGSPRIMLIFGPTGSGKSTLIEVVCRQNNINILEYIPSRDLNEVYFDKYDHELNSFEMFKKFLNKASQQGSLTEDARKKSIILLEDLPNIAHHIILSKFQDLLINYSISNKSRNPILITYNDSENIESLDGLNITFNNWFPKSINNPKYLYKLYLNPVPETYFIKQMTKCVEMCYNIKLTKSSRLYQTFKDIYQLCNGDLRAGLIKLQMCCVGLNYKNIQNIQIENNNSNIDFKYNINSFMDKIFLTSYEITNLDEFIDKCIVNNNLFQNYLIENSAYFVRDIDNLANISDTYSLLNSTSLFQKDDIKINYNYSGLLALKSVLTKERHYNQKYQNVKYPMLNQFVNFNNKNSKALKSVKDALFQLNYFDIKHYHAINSNQLYNYIIYIYKIMNHTEDSLIFQKILNGFKENLPKFFNLDKNMERQMKKVINKYLSLMVEFNKNGIKEEELKNLPKELIDLEALNINMNNIDPNKLNYDSDPVEDFTDSE